MPSWAKQSSKPSYGYDEITGTEEKKTNQEFVYRACPSTIKAKSLTLDSIYGKTLAWNQLIVEKSAGTTTTNGVTVVSDGHGCYTVSTDSGGATADYELVLFTTTWIQGHKYLLAGCPPGGSSSKYCIDTGWFGVERGSGMVINNTRTDVSYWPRLFVKSGTVITTPVKFCPIFIDLTLMFGAGNEPSTVEEFESMFPGYHSYEPGKLISNYAAAVKTIGFNLWDEKIQFGYWSGSDGLYHYTTGQLCSINPIQVIPNTNYYRNKQVVTIIYYDAGMNVLGYNMGNLNFTTPNNCRYVHVNIESEYGTTYNQDVCVNFSDTSKNGTYEPYKPNIIDLNLKDLRVKSPNIWDEEGRNGYYKAHDGEYEYSSSYPNHFCSKNPIPVAASTAYYVNRAASFCFYDGNGSFISATSDVNNFRTPSNAAYINFTVGNYGTTYNNDICINLSSSFNGQYEPHGDITITGGLKSAGDVRDEIVGNKYIKRVGEVILNGTETVTLNTSFGVNMFLIGMSSASVPNISIDARGGYILSHGYSPGGGVTGEMSANAGNKTASLWKNTVNATYYNIIDNSFSTAAQFKEWLTAQYQNGTPLTLYYAYDNVSEEYTLVSPLVPTVKAGTTEARISPNSDGLSAPMVCDMTYDVDCEYILGEVNNKLGDIETLLKTI